ncbi:hypothetical protein, partial [Pseudomonas viridiflava]|uniref:hypothetical protein n=1 Tax=Pseudomonas viridiflava TaxID=33069 RepID=UPI00197F2500
MIVPDVVPNVFDDLDPAAQGAKMELSQSNAMFFCSAHRSKNLSSYRIQPTKPPRVRSENRLLSAGSQRNFGACYNNYCQTRGARTALH